MMVRLSLAGGTAYGTAKVGVWSDSTDSQDKLKEARKSLYEIEYPAAVSNHLHPASPVSYMIYSFLCCVLEVINLTYPLDVPKYTMIQA